MSSAAAGLILAAGAGSRFGADPKLLAPLEGRPLLQHVVDVMNAVSELEPVVAVLGSRAEQVLAEVRFGRTRTVVCPGWAEGLSASLRCGVAALGGASRVLVVLGDAPGLNAPVLRRLLAAGPGSRASYRGVPGHPVVLGPEQLARVDQLRGDVGARELLGGAAAVECGDVAFGEDVDTPADLEEISLRRPG